MNLPKQTSNKTKVRADVRGEAMVAIRDCELRKKESLFFLRVKRKQERRERDEGEKKEEGREQRKGGIVGVFLKERLPSADGQSVWDGIVYRTLDCTRTLK